MLTLLRIKNLALVEDLTLEVSSGYSAITGETGAGKSVLIGALNLVLGERADRTWIRAGSDACTVEAVFELSGLKDTVRGFLRESGVEEAEAGALILKRTFTATGANRQFINGSPTTLQVLSRLGETLVDLHGPHDHQSLLHPARQLALVDAYGGLETPRTAFANTLRQRSALEAEKAALVVDEQTYAQQLDLLRFQIAEIESADLRPEEETALEAEFRRVSHAARLVELAQDALRQLDDDEGSILTQASGIGRALHELQRLDPTAGPLVELHGQAASLLQDLHRDLGRYADGLEVDPARLQQLEERIHLLHSLRRKYGSTIEAILAHATTTRRKLETLEQRDTELQRLNQELARVDGELRRLGDHLTRERRKVIPRLRKAVMTQLADLGFRQSDFDISLATAPFETASPANSWTPSGFDTLEFQFAPNPGEPARPLRTIASSGEMARVMLALKTVLAAEDDIPVLVFDEVDANVGGETAHAVGEKMRRLGEQRQVLCITHLAPVAAPADAHFVVDKETRGGRTLTQVRPLDHDGRVIELSRMLGGHSDAARKHAEELLRNQLPRRRCSRS